MSKLINLTPHTLNVLDTNNSPILSIPSSGIARAAQTRETVGSIDGIPVNKTSFGAVQNLPDPEPDTFYIVSALTAQAVPEREDVLIVDDSVRDEQGRIIGCRAFAHI